jgi:hypothetical protein
MTALSDKVPIPPLGNMNVGLSACTEDTMLRLFGRPRPTYNRLLSANGRFQKACDRCSETHVWTARG